MKKTFKNEIKNLFDFEKGQLINFYCNNDNCKIINDIFNYYSDKGLYIDLWYNDDLKKVITKSLNVGFITSFQIIKTKLNLDKFNINIQMINNDECLVF